MKENALRTDVICPLMGPEFTVNRLCNIPHLREKYIGDLGGTCTKTVGGCSACIFTTIYLKIDAIETMNAVKAYNHKMRLHSSRGSLHVMASTEDERTRQINVIDQSIHDAMMLYVQMLNANKSLKVNNTKITLKRFSQSMSSFFMNKISRYLNA